MKTNNKTNRACAVCGSKEHRLLYERKFERTSDALLDGYNVVACGACGFCFGDKLPSQEEFDNYYEKQSKYENECREGNQSEFETRRRPLTTSIISGWMPNKQARILDIGCANGDLLAELRKQGYQDIQGVDPSGVCARTAKTLYGINVVTAPLAKIPREIGSFDLVILASVLEHIVDLHGTVDSLRRLLKPRGSVYVEVPDMTRCSRVNDAPFQEFSVEHINYFGPTSLENFWHAKEFKTVGVRQTEINYMRGLTIFEVKGMFQRAEGEQKAEWKIESQTEPELRRYIQMATEKLNRVARAIDSLAESKRPIIVWGVGTHTQSLMATTRLKEANIVAFVDSNTRYVGQKLNGIPILNVNALKNHTEPVLVSSQQFQSEIVEQMRAAGLPNEPITLYR